MRAAPIAFLAGILLLVSLPDLPDTLFVGFLPALVLFALFSSPTIRVFAWFGIGFVWALFRAEIGLANILPMTLESQDLVLDGIVASIPIQTGRKTGFLLDVVEIKNPRTGWGDGQRIRLNWYGSPPQLLPGEKWHLTVRLKRPRGFRNPGGFDYEKWLFQERIHATGYVRSAKENSKLATDARRSLDRMRYRLARKIDEVLGDSPHGNIVKALAIGVRDGIAEAQWETLRSTGTAHLMAISGLHIGLVTMLIFFIARRLWTLFPSMALIIPAQRLAAPIAVAGALGYAALAGFSLPTQRALVMVCVVMAGIFWRRHTSPGFSLVFALFVILLLDPFSVLSIGFWLSFAAVAIILFGMTGHLSVRKSWWRWGRVQILIAIGLMPLSVLFFHEHPLISPVANLIAIPWIGFVVVPLVLAGTCLVTLLPDLGGLLLSWGNWAIAIPWPFLQGLESLDFVYRTGFAPPLWTVIAGGAGVILLLLPRGMPGRWLGVIWLLPLFLISPPRPAAGEIWFTLLDVGQGLAAVVRTREHVLVYDTGPIYGPGFDAGKAAVIPFLRNQGITFVDRVITSHEDADHAGGLASLLAEIPVDTIFTNGHVLQAEQSKRGTACREGVEWHWDGVDFKILHPASDRASGNNGSCVLRITNAEGTILLTGDIEHPAEARLVKIHGDELRTDVFVVPHHGSKTSSSEQFLQVVKPRYALFSTGYRNRFGLPSEPVVARYRQVGAKLLFSDRDGAIDFRLTPGKGISEPILYREQARHFWHDFASR
ncbi:MAG: DNA internalization-related competence protein ComEC/Rec2 [Gammaproteobacteria bacterium]|nr:DNA internalization-related competence protein ComEC/Rec2 [Gammaproteobacteria bacterium]NNJ85409.1 DNA internalization-related competence protein ComEC/Rec2 [Gammaproteobacteria bacterium]